MAQLTPRFSSNRAVREYTEQHYLPAAESYLRRAADGCAVGKSLMGLRKALQEAWPKVRFGDVQVESSAQQHLFTIRVALGAIEPAAVAIELYAEGVNGSDPERHELELSSQLAATGSEYVYRGAIPATRPALDYTARAVPRYGVAVPLEDAHILWQR